VGLGSDEFGDGVPERRVRVDVEDGKRVPAVLDAAFVEDHADEVHARVLEKR
jgi:hypothetical protein